MIRQAVWVAVAAREVPVPKAAVRPEAKPARMPMEADRLQMEVGPQAQAVRLVQQVVTRVDPKAQPMVAVPMAERLAVVEEA